MLDPSRLVTAFEVRGFGPFLGVPCSYLGGVISAAEASPTARYLVANNEGESVAIAVGMRLAGSKPVVIMQNSGLGNAVNPLTSLAQTMAMPVLLLVTWRGQPGLVDEPQHALMGSITRSMLDDMGIRNEPMPEDHDGFERLLAEADEQLATQRLPFAFVVPRGSVAAFAAGDGPTAGGCLTRAEVIDLVVAAVPSDAAIVATTGKTARELEVAHDRPGNLYVVGSMGCASSIALGIALQNPHRCVVVIDGDGAALMRLEAMATIGRLRPPNLRHVLLDNAAYESTGGQPTGSPDIDFVGLALSCGYDAAVSTRAPEDIARSLKEALASRGSTLLHVAVRGGSDPGLGRPALRPSAASRRFEEFLSR